MSEKKKKMPNSLRRRILTFGASVMLMVILVGGLMALAALRNMQSYQEIMNQMTKIHQLKAEISAVGELMQNNVVGGEENDKDCLDAWENLSRHIDEVEQQDGSGTMNLLIRDLQSYQRNTREDFVELLHSQEGIELQYQSFLLQQEDRQFLCDQLLKYLSEHMADRYGAIMEGNRLSLMMFAVVVTCLLLVTATFSYTLAQDIYRPVQRLTMEAERIMEGDYQMDDLPVAQQDEIGQLTEAFNEMKNRVRENFKNREELWRLESLLQDAEFRALQSQVNPHFLFNVLSVATEAALLENADRTVDIVENISYMLHYGLTSVREDSWLADEWKMVRSYVFLQQERFGERIEFCLRVPEEMPLLRIPGMTLQPIVENALKHGVEKMTSGGRVEITMQQTEDAVEVCVADNGGGIPQERVEALNRGESVRGDSRSTGLGVANVSSRLAIFYGRPGLLRIESREGEGTRVYLKYLIQEEWKDVSGTDRG